MQQANAEKARQKNEKIAGPSGTAFTSESQVFGAVRAKNYDRVRELLQTGGNVNASESPPWWMFAGTAVMPFILLCAFSSQVHYSKTLLHIAMMAYTWRKVNR